MVPALLVPPGGAADPNWVAMKVSRLFVSGIYHNYTGRGWIPPFCPGHILCCVHSQNTEIQALLSPLQLGINKPSTDAPSAMAEVREFITTHQKPYQTFNVLQESTRLYYKQAKYFFQSYIAIM